ncbi:MAG: Uma2 family endonuclease [Anaerolineae bacterium]
MAVEEKTHSVEQFMALDGEPAYAAHQLELHDGRLIVVTPSGGLSATIAFTIARHLGNYLAEHDIWLGTGADGGYLLDEQTLVAPDVGFVRYDSLRHPG